MAGSALERTKDEALLYSRLHCLDFYEEGGDERIVVETTYVN